MKKALVAFAIAATLSAPTLAADRGNGNGQAKGQQDGGFVDADLLTKFQNQGQCQSRLIQIRNSVRKGVGVNLPGSTTNLVCKVITGGEFDGLFQLVNKTL